jgi:hypothetical protein
MGYEDIVKGLFTGIKAQVAEKIEMGGITIIIQPKVVINNNTYSTESKLPKETAERLAASDPDTIISLSDVTSAELNQHEEYIESLSEPEQAQEITSTASATAIDFFKHL